MPKPTGKIRTQRSFNNLEVQLCPNCGNTFTKKDIKVFKTFWNHTRLCEEILEKIPIHVRYQELIIEADTCFDLQVDD